MSPLRIWLVGFGAVGRWLADALDAQAERLAARYGRQLRREQVTCQGITGITCQQARQAASAGGRLRHIAALAFSGPDGTGTVTARVQPEAVAASDPLASIDGVTNALIVQASPVGEIMITGPGAGPRLAGQGVLSDIIAVAQRQAH